MDVCIIGVTKEVNRIRAVITALDRCTIGEINASRKATGISVKACRDHLRILTLYRKGNIVKVRAIPTTKVARLQG